MINITIISIRLHNYESIETAFYRFYDTGKYFGKFKDSEIINPTDQLTSSPPLGK